MEPRKIQRVGASTLTISLPSKWAKKMGMKKGDLVYLEENEDGSLKLMSAKPGKEKASRTIEINSDLCNDSKMLGRVLMGVYSLGYDTVRVTSKYRLKNEHVEKIRNTTRELLGIGIMEEALKQVMIQCSMDVAKFTISTLLRRLYIIASTMHRDVIDSLSEFDVRLAEGAILRKREAETLFWVIVRLINSCQKDNIIAKKMKVEDSIQILWSRLIAQYLRLVADWAEKSAKKVVALRNRREIIGEDLLNEMIEINERSYGACHKAINSFFSGDVYLANQAIEDYDEIQKAEEHLQEAICNYAYLHGKSIAVSKYLKGKKSIDPCMIAQISFLIWSARRIAELGSEIAETAIHRVLCEHTKLCEEHTIEE